jgi:hypothetical protein
MARRFFCTAGLFLCVLMVSAPAAAAPVIFSVSGASSGDIQATVDVFRSVLGNLNPNEPGSFPGGRREINWDGVPAASSAPDLFPGNFFNAATPGRARGIEFFTPGLGFQVSAASGNPTATPIQFGNLNPTYPGLFATFSPEKLFTPLGSNVTDATFFVPGSATPATVSGFGAVFTDVDLANSTTIQFFDPANALLGSFFVPSAPGNETLSFLGVVFNGGEHVSRVRIITGNTSLGPNEAGGFDLVVMDDFIYAEPQATTPLPGTFLLLGTGLAGCLLRRRFLKK